MSIFRYTGLTMTRDRSFAELVRAGKFAEVDASYLDASSSGGAARNGPERSELVLINMGTDYSPTDLNPMITLWSRIIGRPLDLATPYELAYYGSRRNDRHRIVAFGPEVFSPGCVNDAALIWPVSGGRRLSRCRTDCSWLKLDLVLCVCPGESDRLI